jgi:hypothetical protein
MAGSQQRERNHKRSRPGSQRPLAPSRTTQAPERSDQQLRIATPASIVRVNAVEAGVNCAS